MQLLELVNPTLGEIKLMHFLLQRSSIDRETSSVRNLQNSAFDTTRMDCIHKSMKVNHATS